MLHDIKRSFLGYEYGVSYFYYKTDHSRVYSITDDWAAMMPSTVHQNFILWL
jgi:hypothetical protein